MSNLLSTLKSLKSGSILVIGDIMLDCYFYGTIDRISPEAPVPILKINRAKEMLGGAGNVVTNVNGLGARVHIISLVGDDMNGEKVRNLLNSLSLTSHQLITLPKTPTITKTRFVSESQQILRTDVEKIFELSETDQQLICSAIEGAIEKCNAIILSDYKKGLLTKEICSFVIDLARKKRIPVLVDPKGKDYSFYSGATLIKPNLKELRDAFYGEDIASKEVEYARRLLVTNKIDCCLVTMGKDGMLLVTLDDEQAFSSRAREVFDVSGAGDTVIATLACAYAVGATMEDACVIANVAGGIVVTKAGTASVLPLEIENEIQVKGKIFKAAELLTQIQIWRSQDYRIGFTNGCFDILHSGHIKTIKFAKQNCDRLIVALNSDASVRKLKGAGRPINSETERCLILSELGSIDGVVIFDEETPESLIRVIKPDVLVKGADYKQEDVVGYDFIRSYGGKVLLCPIIETLSTTNIITKIKSA